MVPVTKKLDLITPFPVQDTFSRPANQGSACSSYHGFPEEVPILKDSTFLSWLLAPPAADKRREPRVCSPSFLQKTRMKLHHPLPTNTPEQSSDGKKRRKRGIRSYQIGSKKTK
ncbi:hypothetical protein AXF42_Ash006582 [Apostasia shenzhenica]|uniref:Uncharacterized protein n=1 Tax=Apostasia shenzhenica TaxID=1088818 RepID=A0A2I0AZH7_9ASPA|nr:hypothetical protein AXF42_Ash006582 [Apostasia shenzhenica]